MSKRLLRGLSSRLDEMLRIRILLLQFLHFRAHESLPQRVNDRGGHTFYGVGSHFLYPDHLRDRWYRFAFEVVTIDQPAESVLEQSQLLLSSSDGKVAPHENTLDWSTDLRHRSALPKYSGYRWFQQLQMSLDAPGLITVDIELKFSHLDRFVRVEGNTHFLPEIHPGPPPKTYGKPMWYLRKWLGKRS